MRIMIIFALLLVGCGPTAEQIERSKSTPSSGKRIESLERQVKLLTESLHANQSLILKQEQEIKKLHKFDLEILEILQK